MNNVKVANLNLPEPNMREIMRYSQSDETGLPLIEECLKEVGEINGRVCYSEFDVSKNDGKTSLGFAYSDSEDLKKNLEGCERIILFASTLGFKIDRLIEKYERLSPSKALVMQAIGSERAETLANCFNNNMINEYEKLGYKLHPRFSPGYGDLELSLQKDIIRVLNATKNIGIVLDDSCLMMPSKSVTAIIGIEIGD